MPKVSIIIPMFFRADLLETTLASVLRYRPEDCEVLVPHAAAYADPYQLAGEVAFLPQSADAGEVDLLNAGVIAAKSDVVHILAPGCEVDEGWVSGPLSAFADPLIGSVSVPIVRGANQLVSMGVGCRWGGKKKFGARRTYRPASAARFSPIGPDLTAAYYRRSALLALTGFSAEVGLEFADLDAAISLQTLGFSTGVDSVSLVRCNNPPSRGSLRKGMQAERFFWRHYSEDSGKSTIAVHLLDVIVESLGSVNHPTRLLNMLGRCGCLFSAKDCRNRYEAMLADAHAFSSHIVAQANRRAA